MRELAGRAGLIIAAVGCGAVIAACGGSTGTTGTTGTHTTRTHPKLIDIYSSLPLNSRDQTQVNAIIDGIRLALAQNHYRAGHFRVRYRSLNDGTPQAGGFTNSQTASVARTVSKDPLAVYYIGDFDSAASQISIPILNQAGLAQVSPTNTYLGLTKSVPPEAGGARGKPNLYPTGTRTFMRIVPVDTIQAEADLKALKQRGCTRVAVGNDGELYGESLAELISAQAKAYGVNIISSKTIDPRKPRTFATYAANLRLEGANCFMFAGTLENGGVPITQEVHLALPKAPILGPDGMCSTAWTKAVTRNVDPYLWCTSPTPNLAGSAEGSAFLTAYRDRYRVRDPDPYAALGYEAAELGLQTISDLGAHGDDRSAVLNALRGTRDRLSVLGEYSFDSSGDTTLRSYGLYRAGPTGRLVSAGILPSS